ncbi:MAG: GMC oxidoreductase, partial [Spongiibacter marinus]|uniref:GMC oxidoreductase n=1 Tax=Spongiibacter marinus TaxID=354246 RepID=UPI003C564866
CVDWKYTQQDVNSIKETLRLFSDDLFNSGVGRFIYNEDDVELEMMRYGAYGGHHIGTTRMGLDPKFSVVDKNCKVHSTSNLYISSSSVFPTSSQANPTLTIVALALRLACHLAEKKFP